MESTVFRRSANPGNQVSLFEPSLVPNFRKNRYLNNVRGLRSIDRKVLNSLQENARPLIERGQTAFTLSIGCLLRSVGHESNDKQYFNETIIPSLKRLRQTIEIIALDDEGQLSIDTGWALYGFISYAAGSWKDQFLSYGFDPFILKQVAEPEENTLINLICQQRLNSKGSSYAHYELLSDHRPAPGSKEPSLTPAFPIEYLCEFYGLKGKTYRQFKHLNNRAIKPNNDAVSQNTDLKANVIPIRKDRRIVSVRFEVFNNPKFSPVQNHDPALRNRMIDYGLAPLQVDQFLLDYPEDYLREKLRIVDNYDHADKPAGLLYKAIKENYQPPKSSKKHRTEQRQQREVKQLNLERTERDLSHRAFQKLERQARLYLESLTADEVQQLQQKFGEQLDSEFARKQFDEHGVESKVVWGSWIRYVTSLLPA